MSVNTWETLEVLITVRTYPTPAKKGIEVSCTAGITRTGDWIRLFPVPYRLLPNDKQFHKYQWVRLSVSRSSDHRVESYRIDPETIEILTPPLSSANGWRDRKAVVTPQVSQSLCALRRERDLNKSPTLGLFRPKKIIGLSIEPDTPDWTESQRNQLSQLNMFDQAPRQELQKIPFRFRYRFFCDEPQCTGHHLTCSDWEIHQAYRNWSAKYGKEWEGPFRQRFEAEMIEKYDTHFYVGTIHQHPQEWIIIGLFYPPRINQPQLFPPS